MRADLPPEIIEALERRHQADLAAIRKLGSPARPGEEEHDCALLEDLSIVLWILVIVAIASLCSMYGTALRDALWSWLL